MAPMVRAAFVAVASLVFSVSPCSLGAALPRSSSIPPGCPCDRSLRKLSGEALCSAGNLSTGEREDRDNRWVVVLFTLIGYPGPTQTAKRCGPTTDL